MFPVALLNFLVFCAFLIDGLQILIKSIVLLQACIKPVFNVVVDSSRHEFLNLDPFVSILLMKLHQLNIFRNSPFFLVEIWIDIVIPSFTALFANSTRKVCGYFFPFLQTKINYLFPQDRVFFWSPVTFNLFYSTVFSVIFEIKPSFDTHNFYLLHTI